MKTRPIMHIAAFLLVALTLTGAGIPYLTGRVNDTARILSTETKSSLGDKLRVHEELTTNQVAILTIPSLDGESIEEYANRVFQDWGLGQKDKDNGLLILVVPDDRQMRIEVGYGLESTMTDLMAGLIIHNIMTPKFKEGDYDEGLIAGTDAVLSVLQGDTLTESVLGIGAEADDGFLGMDEPIFSLSERLVLGAFIFGILGIFTLLGILTAGFGWFMYVFLIPFWAVFPVIVLGSEGSMYCLIGYLVLFPILKLSLRKSKWLKNLNAGTSSFSGISSSSGSRSSWVSGGGSSGSSSFSGGGGSSGGGGASGSW